MIYSVYLHFEQTDLKVNWASLQPVIFKNQWFNSRSLKHIVDNMNTVSMKSHKT